MSKNNRIAKARDALIITIGALPKGSYFNIIDFDSGAVPLFAKSKVLDDTTREQGIAFAQKMTRASGGTNIYTALNKALDVRATTGVYNQTQVFVLTDGYTRSKKQTLDLINDQVDDMRVFTVGIGSDCDKALLTLIPEKTAEGAYASFICDHDSAFIGNKAQPRLKDNMLKWMVASSIAHVKNIKFKLRAPNSVSVKSQIDNSAAWIPNVAEVARFVTVGHEGKSPISKSRANQHMRVQYIVHRLGAASRDWVYGRIHLKARVGSNLHNGAIKAILTKQEMQTKYIEYMNGGHKDNALKQEIIALSKNSSVLSPFTSSIAVEDEDEAEYYTYNSYGGGTDVPEPTTVYVHKQYEAKAVTTISGFQRLIMAQAANGRWSRSKLMALKEVNDRRGELDAAVAKLPGNQKQAAWTLVGIALLTEYFDDIQVEWYLYREKAWSFIEESTGTGAGKGRGTLSGTLKAILPALGVSASYIELLL
jgi:hypothetical protein